VLQISIPELRKHRITWFETTDTGCRWREAALTQAMFPYRIREFIRLWFHVRSA